MTIANVLTVLSGAVIVAMFVIVHWADCLRCFNRLFHIRRRSMIWLAFALLTVIATLALTLKLSERI